MRHPATMPPSRSTWAKSFLAPPRLSSMSNLIGPGLTKIPSNVILCPAGWLGVLVEMVFQRNSLPMGWLVASQPRRGGVQNVPLHSEVT